MNQQNPPRMFAASLGLFNLSGFGFGYLHLKRWIRWAIHILITLALLVTGTLLDAAKFPIAWIVIVSLWLLWMAFDGWRQGKNFTPEESLFPTTIFNKHIWLFIVIPLLILCLEGAGLAGYRTLGKRAFQKGNSAYLEADCEKALNHFKQVTTFYELTLSENVSTADARIQECKTLLPAEKAYQAGNHEEAIQLYKKYLSANPESPLAPHTQESLSDSYYKWAGNLKADNKYQKSIDKYLVILEDYPDTEIASQVAPHLFESYLAISSQKWEEKDYQEAVEYARLPLETYPDNPAGKSAQDQIAEIYCDWAEDLKNQGLYGESAEKILIVLDEFPDTQAGKEAPDQIAQLYYQWAKELHNENRHAAAVETILTVLEDYPNTQSGKKASSLAAEIYYDWATDLQEKESYQVSLEVFEILLTQYDSYFDDINADYKAAYMAWTNDLRESGKYSSAIEKYQDLQKEHPEMTSEEEISQLITKTYLEWGNYLIQKEQYWKAIEKFDDAKELTDDPDLIASVEDGYHDALWGISHDEGSQGQDIIQVAYQSVCNGNPAESPAIGFATDEPGKALACSSDPTLRIPNELKPDYPGHFQYVVSLTEGQKTLNSCRYQGGHTLYRQQVYWSVSLRSTLTGEVYTTKTFFGSQPGKCERVEWFYGQDKYKTGSEPSMEEVTNWLEVVVP